MKIFGINPELEGKYFLNQPLIFLKQPPTIILDQSLTFINIGIYPELGGKYFLESTLNCKKYFGIHPPTKNYFGSIINFWKYWYQPWTWGKYFLNQPLTAKIFWNQPPKIILEQSLTFMGKYFGIILEQSLTFENIWNQPL